MLSNEVVAPTPKAGLKGAGAASLIDPSISMSKTCPQILVSPKVDYRLLLQILEPAACVPSVWTPDPISNT